MKLKQHRKYQAPRIGSTFLEAEGLMCDSNPLRVMVDEHENINATKSATDEGVGEMYFEF